MKELLLEIAMLSTQGQNALLIILGVILFAVFVHIIIRAPRYEYINGVVERSLPKPKVLETKHEKALYENPLITYFEIRIHLKKGTYEIYKNGVWILLSEDQKKDLAKQINDGEEHPVITLP